MRGKDVTTRRTASRGSAGGSEPAPLKKSKETSTHRGRKHQRQFSLILACYLVFASSIAALAAHVFHDHSRASAAGRHQSASLTPQPPKYLVLMVLDGARPDYFDVTNLPHVNALRARGTQFADAFDGILEAETPAGHATIATGSRPDRDGILGFDWASDNDRYSLFSPQQMGTLEQILEDYNVPTIGSLYKAQHPKARVVALSGHKYYAAAPLGGPDADAILFYQGDPKGRYVPVAVPGHVPPAGVLSSPGLISPTTHLPPAAEDHLATKLALAVQAKMHPRILLINYPEFDWPLGHVDGGILDKPRVITDMKGFDVDLGKIEGAYRKAGILDKTLFVITADHGMMPITHFVPSTVVSNAISAAGTTAPDIASNSGDYIWLADAGKAQAVADNIMAAGESGIQSAYYLTSDGGKPAYVRADGAHLDPATESVNQYMLGALLNGHEPSVVVFGKEGVSFSSPTSNWKADHGGNSWESQHIPLIFAGPGIKKGTVQQAPAQLDDVAPTVLAAMGVAPTGMEGHVLSDALQDVVAREKHARRHEVKRLVPMVRSLMAER